MKERMRVALDLAGVFGRLAFALFVCLPIILVDEQLTRWRAVRRLSRGR